MLIDSKVTSLLEGVRKLQNMVQTTPGVSSLDKLRSQQILRDCESDIFDTFGLEKAQSFERVPLEGALSAEELSNKATVIAMDAQNIFKTFGYLPATKGKDIQYLKKRDDDRLALNKFTNKQGHIRAEFGNDTELFYIIQYMDGSYGISTEINIQLQ